MFEGKTTANADYMWAQGLSHTYQARIWLWTIHVCYNTLQKSIKL